jgi:TIR domain
MSQPAVEIFFSYAHEDEALRDKLAKHLKLLEREGIIKAWHDRDITAGEEWKNAIDSHLESANIILLLISADFLASDYCYDIEMKRSLERHDRKEARVIPVILRSVDWQSSPFGKLNALPKDGKAVTSWENIDEAFTDVVKGLRRVIDKLQNISFTLEETTFMGSHQLHSEEFERNMLTWLIETRLSADCTVVLREELDHPRSFNITTSYCLLDIGERNFEEVYEYIQLLADAGLAEIQKLDRNFNAPREIAINRITMEGRSFVRNSQKKTSLENQPEMTQTNRNSSTGFQINVGGGGTVNITPPNPQH